MEAPNITSVFKYQKQSGEQAFFYSVRNTDNPTQYSYYVLEKGEDEQPHIRRVAQIINVLQGQSIEFIPLNAGTEEYELFITSLAVAIRPISNQYSNPNIKQYRKVKPGTFRIKKIDE